MDFKPGELKRLMCGGESTRAGEYDERLECWAEAFDAWLEERYTRFSRNVGPDSHRAWQEFLAFTRKAPWEVRADDVEAYIKVLEGKGLSAWTIHKRLTGLKKFYEYCQEEGGDNQCQASFNPAAQARRPRVKLYEKANYLSLEEEAAGRGVGGNVGIPGGGGEVGFNQG
jgi:site-specific recombinase XerD